MDGCLAVGSAENVLRGQEFVFALILDIYQYINSSAMEASTSSLPGLQGHARQCVSRSVPHMMKPCIYRNRPFRSFTSYRNASPNRSRSVPSGSSSRLHPLATAAADSQISAPIAKSTRIKIGDRYVRRNACSTIPSCITSILTPNAPLQLYPPLHNRSPWKPEKSGGKHPAPSSPPTAKPSSTPQSAPTATTPATAASPPCKSTTPSASLQLVAPQVASKNATQDPKITRFSSPVSSIVPSVPWSPTDGPTPPKSSNGSSPTTAFTPQSLWPSPQLVLHWPSRKFP